MSKSNNSFATRQTPKGKEMFAPQEYLDRHSHAVYFTAVQVRGSVPPSAFKEGLRVAIYEERGQFQDQIPAPIFYTGTVRKIWGNPDDPLMTIEYDAHPWCTSVSLGIKQYARLCIPAPTITDIKRAEIERKKAALERDIASLNNQLHQL